MSQAEDVADAKALGLANAEFERFGRKSIPVAEAWRRMSKTIVHEGSGNVFKDLGFPNPEEVQFKSGLVVLIARQIRARKLTQTQAGKILGVGQPKVSDMLRGHFQGYSVERLLGFPRRLGKDVEVRVRDSQGKLGHLRLSA
jgi:predicted XRE-type DNA-binding protein